LLLAIGMLPMIYLTLFRAYRRDWINHRRIAIPTFCIWLYVSVTGVIIYFMLYHTSLST
jgi:protein SCO1/2/putative membrane protein